MISIKNISFTYNPSKPGILDSFNLVIQNGEFISILGKSGCGKTTLANIICGYLKPLSGRIEIDSKLSIRPDKNKIIVNQENDLFDWMTVQQNMEIATHDPKIICKFLKIALLDKKIDEYPGQLSGGMKKRLSLVRALAAKPDLLVLDEPFSYLDYSTKTDLLKQFQKIIKATKTTTILITHNIDESIYLSNRVVVLKGHPVRIVNDIKIENDKLAKKYKYNLIKKIKKAY